MRKKIFDENLKQKIQEILTVENRSMSIREIKNKLYELYEIKRSPQIILRHLIQLKKENKVNEENGEKI